MKKVRCAIYTRKSSEEGLEQDFNSLHAQREACVAYILSQPPEGWSLPPGDYDDDGLSAGTLERPALQRLLADREAGRIDIVVYKVDRLTRSLLDFSKLVEAMDKAGTSFVSVTQSFNTTNSMGRLTPRREATAGRITGGSPFSRGQIYKLLSNPIFIGEIHHKGQVHDGKHEAIIDPETWLAVQQLLAASRQGERAGQRTWASCRTQ